jgi:hypothetical protein
MLLRPLYRQGFAHAGASLAAALIALLLDQTSQLVEFLLGQEVNQQI